MLEDVFLSEEISSLGCSPSYSSLMTSRASEAWTLQIQDRSYPQSGLGPAFAKILSVRRFQPHGAIVATSQAGVVASDQVLCADSSVPFCFAAVFSTRSQVASQMRDTPESVALYSLSVMATSAVLSQMSTLGINLPVFGVMFDRNIVRLHVDWAVDVSISISYVGMNSYFILVGSYICPSSPDVGRAPVNVQGI